MTSADVVKIKAIGALLEAINPDDEDDAKMAIKMIRGLIDPGGRERRQATPVELATVNGEAD